MSESEQMLYLCRASGEGTHNFRIADDEAGVMTFYEEMFGKNYDGNLNDAIEHFRDLENWSNGGTAYRCALYCAEFEVWKVPASELNRRALSPSEPAEPVAEIIVSTDLRPGEHGRRVSWLTNPVDFAYGTKLYLAAPASEDKDADLIAAYNMGVSDMGKYYRHVGPAPDSAAVIAMVAALRDRGGQS